MILLQMEKMKAFLGLFLVVLLLEGTTIQGRFLESDIMSFDDAKYYMDATANSDGHEFEIVSPWEVEGSRQRREADNPFDISEYKFSAFGEEFHLQLTTNRHLTAKGLTVQHVDAQGNVEERPLPAEHEDCYKFGSVLSHEGASRVTVSTCNNGLSGMVKLEKFEMFIQKLTDNHTESVRRKRRDIHNPHIVYRRSAEDDDMSDEETSNNSTHFCALETSYYQNVESQLGAHEDGDADSHQRRKRQATCDNGAPIGTKILELFLVIDASMVNFHNLRGVSATSYALTLMNIVAGNYFHGSLGIPLIVKIVRLQVLQSDTTAYNGGSSVLSVSPDGGTTLRSFCGYQSFINSFNQQDPGHFDNAVLLSRYDLELSGNKNLLGIAQYDGACAKEYSCALVEESGLGSGLVITHELGHNLGMEHDGGSRFSAIAAGCSDGVNIMSSSRTNGPDSFIWSSCSKDQLNIFLCKPWKTCLDDDISGSSTITLNPQDMPGKRISGREQCWLINSQTTGICTQHNNICGHLACELSNGGCIGTGVAALDGTDCGGGKICSQGLCVQLTSPVNPVNGGWSAWRNGQCSVTCGQGTMTLTRQCNNPEPQNGGLPCAGSTTETETCTRQSCPVNGGWSSWQLTGSCSVTCGGGHQQATRVCNNPPPQNGGAYCSGSSVQTYTCNTQQCAINGGWSSWQSGPCSQSCGGGQQTLTRTCNNPPPQSGGAYCPGSDRQVTTCNTQPCVTVVNGEWSDWTYSSCSQTCGGGTQSRYRSCNNPQPENGGQQCAGSNYERDIPCNTEPCSVDGGWSSWGPFGQCSVTCGGSGQRTRSRSCNNPTPQNGGQQCSGLNTENVQCNNNQACPVNGGWSAWSTYGPCSVTCGAGERTRSRSCNSPSPQNGGQQCSGSNTEITQCDNNQVCPVNGGWSAWSTFGPCSVTCGGGEKTRSRSCNSPSPQNGGQYCAGSGTDTQSCNTQSCPSSSDQEVTGTFTGGPYGEYKVFLTIPEGATAVNIQNRGTTAQMAIIHGNEFVLGWSNSGTVPARHSVQVIYQGTSIRHNFNNLLEMITIEGPTTVELKVAVHVIDDPSIHGSQVQGNVVWSYLKPVIQYEWVKAEGDCSVTCGPGVRTEVIHCVIYSNEQQYIANDDSACDHLPKPTPAVESCNEATCPISSWFVGQLDCSDRCGQEEGIREVYCLEVVSQNVWTYVSQDRCDPAHKPSETSPCPNLSPCPEATVPCTNTVVTTQGSINRMFSPTDDNPCGYTIVAPVGMKIALELVNYNIDCAQGDELVFKSGSEKSDLCEENVAVGSTLNTQTNLVQIEHKSTQANHGYHIVYNFVYNNQPSDCDEIFLEDSGTITSPQTSSNDRNNQLCKKVIVAPADMKILLTFPARNRCWSFQNIYVSLRDYDEAYRLNHLLCNIYANPPQISYQSTSNRVSLTFKRNEIYLNGGLQASYRFIPRY